MPKKKDDRKDEDLAELIKEMLQHNKTWKEITAELDITNARLSKIVKEYIHKDAQVEESQRIGPGGLQVPPSADQKIVDDTANKSTQMITNSLSEQLYRQFMSRMEAAKVMDEMDSRYRATIESWGYKWEDFIRNAIDHAFDVAKTFKTWEPIIKLYLKVDDI